MKESLVINISWLDLLVLPRNFSQGNVFFNKTYEK